MSDSIKVAIKVRPLIKREKDDNLPIQWAVQGNYIASTDSEIKKRGDGGFHFDHIFDEQTNNKDVFDVIVRPIIDAAVNGFNGTVFAYGQTSSGKTYTMMGALNEPGIIPLAVEYMFDAISNTMRREFLLRVSYLEIYNEKVNDLLNKSGTDLKLQEDVNGQIIVKCKEEVTNSPEHVLSIMKKGDKNRRIGETNMNERSSRSHTIFRITIESRESDADSDGAIQVSQLNLVDLAGSERARQTGATGERFKEGRHINMSLSTLGLVIMQLSEAQDAQKYVNFRDSKLTRLLQASLGGNAMTVIICAITPAALEESQCTLSFASRAKSVKNKPQVNEVMSDATLLKRYAKQIAKLNAELEKMKQKNRTAEEMENKLHEKDQANQLLEERIELLKTKIVSGDNTNIEESFKCRSRRRRTWGGSATFKQNLSLFQPSDILPTIKEMSPEKPCRKSIIQSVDLMNQTFQTAFADFELELINAERDRESEDDSDEELFITKRKSQNHVTFMDNVCVYKPDYDIYETTPEKKHASCQTKNNSPESPGTPKNVLRERLVHLQHEFNELCEFTTLEKQMYIENHQCSTTNEEQGNIAELEQPIKNFIATKTILAENNDMKEHLQKQSVILNGGFNNSLDNEELVTDLDLKTQELHEIKGDVLALKLDMTKLQRTIFLLTTENVELSAKLTAEKEEARESKVHYQKSIDDLCEEICKLKDEKLDLSNENLTLNEQVKSLESQIIDLKENQICLNCQDKQKKLAVTNIELFQTDIEEHVDCKNIDQNNSLTDIEKLADKKDVTENGKNLSLNCSTLKVEVKTSPEVNNETNEKMIEELTMENSLLKTELYKLKEKITVLEEENKRFLKESFKTLTDNIKNNTCDNSIYIGSIFNSTFDTEEKIEDEKPDVLLHKYTILKEKVDYLSELNKKLTELKTTSCAQCAQMKELNENNKVAKLEAKALTHKLEDMQEKFKRKCADIEVLKNKANEELSLSICETSLDASLLDGLNVTCVEEEVSHLNKEMQVLKDDHAKLSHLYEEKCSELEKLHNNTINEIDSASPFKKDTKKSKFRIDKLEKDIDHVKVDLQELKSNVISDLKRSLNEKASLLNEINMLKSVNDELSKVLSQNNVLLETSENNIKSLENKIIHLNTDIENYKMVQEQIQNEKYNLETEMVNMKENINEKEVIIKDLQKVINEYKKEETFCSENFIRENLNTIEHVNKSNHNVENELNNEVEKLKNDLNAIRHCITKEIRSLQINLDDEDLLNKSVDDLFLTFLQILISKEKEIIDTMQQQFSSDKERLENEKQESVNAKNRATMWAKELETEIIKLQNDIAKQDAERCALLDKISQIEESLEESNQEKQILMEQIQAIKRDYNDLQKTFNENSVIKIQPEEIVAVNDKEIELQLKMKQEKEEYEQKIDNLTSTLETFKAKNLELLQNVESLEVNEKHLKNILNTRTDESLQYNEKLKSEVECLTNTCNKLNHEMENKNECITKLTAEVEDLSKSLESYKLQNMELVTKLQGLEINVKDLNTALNTKISELTNSNQNIEKMKTEIEHLVNTCAKLNNDIDNKNAHIIEVTALLQNKSDILSEHKMKLDTILPEVEFLKKQLEDQKLSTNKSNTELENFKIQSEIELTNIKNALNLERIKFAEVNKQLADLKNQNISLVAELDTLKEQCYQLEEKNLKLEQKMRNSISKIKADTQIEDLQEENKTLRSNLEGAYNCIAELKSKKNSLLEELVNIKKQNEFLLEENLKAKDISDKTKQSNLHTLQEQYNALLNEKSKIELELKETNTLLYQKEQDLEHYISLYKELEQKNKELDEEVEELITENDKLTEKVYSYFDDNSGNNLTHEIKILKEENEKLHTRLTRFDSVNKSQTSLQVKTDEVPMNFNDSNKTIQQKKQLACNIESNTNTDINDDKYIKIKKQIQDLELELVSKNGKIAALELQIQSENFPYKKKCRDLEENIIAFKNKNIQLEAETKRLRHALNDINTKECYMSTKGYINTKDQYVQTIPNNRIQFCGTSSGIIDEHLQLQKLEREKSFMKQLCRSRAQKIKELEAKLMELENAKSLSNETNVALKENIFYSTPRSLSK